MANTSQQKTEIKYLFNKIRKNVAIKLRSQQDHYRLLQYFTSQKHDVCKT